MIEGFNLTKIQNVELSLKITNTEFDCFQSPPTDAEIKLTLKSMLTDTIKHFENTEEELEDFDISENYGTTATLKASIQDEELYKKIHDIRDSADGAVDGDIIKNPQNIPYYRVKFYDDEGNVVIGVRTATYFKSILKQRSRIVQLYDDTLTPCNDTLFKLDNDFDFVIAKNDVFVYRPRLFEAIANLEEELLQTAADRVETLARSLEFVNFDGIEKKASESKRAAKLVLSLAARDDLMQISQANVMKNAQETNLNLEQNEAGQIVPKEGSELDFLEMLDRRRYAIELVDGTKEIYRAPSRKKVKTN
ncbi:DUF4868 domain-containing protein [Vibrio alginolyticus]|uniref:DUF4868 domain-containing protein n=1 Tax=Vibrio harveyi group TaxID=717610 RepID=UPI0026596E5C|nr:MULTISPECIES: DUF4868 domain-containing protein [Vibrio harveyi group]EGQ9180259.1 DUF4868 domain-containing protein [Vibrio alginolyticus]MCR9846730.1 DUF4868 domain-containing protein [Vibrio antiquarius]MCR9912319.1 DUF4868 domain-containing protein [Vibrio antiquarius]WMN46757.1 DUF4868 domain-containing protein [Vibrio alginolyticus]